MKKFTLLFLLAFGIAGLSAQPEGEDDHALLSWNPFYKLEWSDFRGEAPDGSKGDAGTSVQIKAKPFMVKHRIYYDVTAIFNRRKSWALDTSASLLHHEQLHFDIAELYARRIRQKVEQLRSRSVDEIKVYNSAIEKLLAESNETDRRYDIETLHGALSKKQESWFRQVRGDLERLDQYKKSKRIVSD